MSTQAGASVGNKGHLNVAEIRKTLAGVFGVKPEEIAPDLQFGDLPAWDSMGHMDLMLALEERFGLEISAESIRRLTSVTAIVKELSPSDD